ncbi:MAG: hypothetical protein NT105_11785 [Verrucomicrobia bacterium]|nr:hypothetical protein [Verrucomicrobiota bacterium]
MNPISRNLLLLAMAWAAACLANDVEDIKQRLTKITQIAVGELNEKDDCWTITNRAGVADGFKPILERLLKAGVRRSQLKFDVVYGDFFFLDKNNDAVLCVKEHPQTGELEIRKFEKKGKDRYSVQPDERQLVIEFPGFGELLDAKLPASFLSPKEYREFLKSERDRRGPNKNSP